MALDLWGSSYDRVACNGSEHPEWQCDSYYGCNREFVDVIEEDALNEDYCVQVLRILITKADTEIEELEKDLLSLQNELAWAEHEKWPQICCSALTERINWLDVAISTLKKDHADEMETRLLLHDKPAETLHEIVKALQRDYCEDTNGQLVDANILNPIVNANEYALDKESSNIDSNIVLKKEGKELSGTTENSRSSELVLELREKRLDDAEKFVLELQEKRSDVAEKLALELQEKRSDDAEKLVLELQEKRSDDAEKLVLEIQEKRLDDAEKLVLEIQENRPDDAEMVEELLAMAIVRRPDFGDISYSPGHSDGMKLSGSLDDGITGNDEVSRSQLIATDTGQILSLLSSKGNVNISRESKRETAIVKGKHVSSYAVRLCTGIKGRKKFFGSSFGASHQQKGRNSDLEKKLCELAPNTARRACKKESEVAPAEDLDSMNYPLQVVYPQDSCSADSELCSFKGGNGKNSRLLMNIQKTSHHAANPALISLFDMQAESVLYTGLQQTDEEKPLAQGLKSENDANLIKSDMSFPSKLKKTQGKRKSELEVFSAREPHDIPTEVTTNASLIVSTKRQQKSAAITDDACSNESINSKTTKRAVQPSLHEIELRAIVPYDSQFSELQKKRKVLKLPIASEINSNANLDIPNSDKVSTDDRSQVDLQLSELHSLVDSQTETADSLPKTLSKFTLSHLKVFAKELNVKKYYSLKKSALVDQLVERLRDC